jgi:CheY-like chemotaxis protein
MARILVIDDEELVRAAIGAALRRAGHIVILAEDGGDALNKFEPDSYDIVITDIVMPRMEGIETMRALRRIEPMIPIIAMSGCTVPDKLYLKAAIALGADATMHKPVDEAELCLIVDEALALPREEMAALWYRRAPA